MESGVNDNIARQIEFVEKWFHTNHESHRRIQLVEKEIANYRSELPILESFLNHKKTKEFIELANIMAYIKPISDTMLTNYIESIILAWRWMKYKRKEDGEIIDSLFNPALSALRELFSTNEWQSYIYDPHIIEGEYFKLGGIEIPITKEALIKYAKRTKQFPFLIVHIDKIKSNFINHNRKQYAFSDEDKKKIALKRDIKVDGFDENQIQSIAENISQKIQFIHRETIKKLIIDLNDYGLLLPTDDKTFAAIASIIHTTRWVNTSTFKRWLSFFSAQVKRECPSYRESQLVIKKEELINKNHIFNQLPKI